MDIADAPGLLQQHRLLTSRLASRIGRSEAEDLASEAVTRGLGRPAPDGRQAPWIERIFRNLVIDRGRRAGRIAASMSSIAEDAPAANPEDALLERERKGALLGAIPTIPRPLRDALMARFYEGQDYDAVASTRGITAATARTRVHRALARLRVSLGRLRASVPAPFAFGSQSITVALLPAVISAGLVIPSLAIPSPGSVVRAETTVVVAQAKTPSPRHEGGASRASVLTPGPAPSTTPTPGSSAASVRRAPARSAPSPTDDRPVAVKRFDYGDDEIIGDLKRPDGIVLPGDPGRAKHLSLIEIPRSFEPAITKMLEDM